MKLDDFFNENTIKWEFYDSCFNDYIHVGNQNLRYIDESNIQKFEKQFNYLLIIDRSYEDERGYLNYGEIGKRYILSAFHHHLILNIATRFQLVLLLLALAAQNDLPALLRIITEQLIIFDYIIDNSSEFEKFRIAHSQCQEEMSSVQQEFIKNSKRDGLKEIRTLLSNIGTHFNSSYFSNSTSSQILPPTFSIIKDHNTRKIEIQKILFDLILYCLHETILIELKYWRSIKGNKTVIGRYPLN